MRFITVDSCSWNKWNVVSVRTRRFVNRVYDLVNKNVYRWVLNDRICFSYPWHNVKKGQSTSSIPYRLIFSLYCVCFICPACSWAREGCRSYWSCNKSPIRLFWQLFDFSLSSKLLRFFFPISPSRGCIASCKSIFFFFFYVRLMKIIRFEF